MASLVLGAAGAAVGSFFGPLGASIGWAVGAGLGNALFPGKGQDGPRLSDLKVHNSSYGQMIPITYGTVRLAGNIIWSTDWVEHEQHSGGKGGPEETSYTYTISFAVGLCEGPIGGVLRIWADSRLVWDPNTMDQVDFPFTLYLGDDTQLPDPTIEAAEGAGNVSGHRGMAYVVFTDLPGADYNNHVPSFTFEVYGAGGPIPWRYSFWGANEQLPPSTSVWNYENRAGPSGSGPQSGAIEGGYLVLSWLTDHVNGDDLTNMPTPFEVRRYTLDGVYVDTTVTAAMPAPAETNGINALTLQCQNNPHICFCRDNGTYVGATLINAFYYDGVMTASPIFDPTGSTSNTALFYAVTACPIFWQDNLYVTGGTGGAHLSRYSAPGGAVTSGSPTAYYYLPGINGGAEWTTKVDRVTGYIWCIANHDIVAAYDEMFVFDTDLNLIHSWAYADWPANFIGTTGGYDIWNNILYFQGLSQTSAYAYRVDLTAFTFTLADEEGGGSLVTFGGSLGFQSYNAISLGGGLLLIANGLVSLNPRPQGITLGEIVEDVSVRAGLTTDQVDVTELTDLVDGYVIANQMAARSAVEPLQVAWPFDAVEHDVLVRFPRRGVDGVQAVIDDDDLGAFIPPGDPPALMTTQRLQEVDLPRIVDTTFINLDTDYQNGEARAQRLITTSELTTSLQLPIVMSSQKGLSVCNENLYNAWIERERFSLSLSRKWLLLEPADVIQANGRTMRITKKVEQADGVIKVDALATSLAVYQHLAPPVEGVGMPGGGGTPPTTPPVIQATDALLLDLPLISDIDNPLGFYAAFAGADQVVWPGAVLYKSVDGGSSFNSVLLQTVSDTFGDCSTTLGDFGGGNVFDETNSLTVVVGPGSGTLSSVTTLAVLNGANRAAVGIPGESGIRDMEIIQFRDATLIGTRTYTLTGLLRGRRGSEWMIPLHTSGETFVLLPTSTNVVGDPAEIYQTRIYRAVTSGRPVSSAANINFQNYGIAALPYAPCHLGGGIQTNGDFILEWTRRTRIGGLWLPFVDVPLSEANELYGVNIYTDGTYSALVTGTIYTSSPTLTYTAAEQTVDFGLPQSVLYWGVQQQGTFNLGTEARAVI